MPKIRMCGPFQIPGAVQWTIYSKEGLSYRIMLWKPNNEAPKNGFPVYYVLDANSIFGTLAETIRLQSSGPRKQEAAVIVGIGYDSDMPIVTDRRFFDYTIPAEKQELPERKIGMEWPENGGIESFLTFIEEEIKVLVESEVKIDKSRQALFGHSLGGLFVLYTLLTRPDSFQYYAAGSPSVWWKNQVIFEYVERFIAGRHAETALEDSSKKLFVGVGSEEREDMIEGAEIIFKRFQKERFRNLEVKYECFQDENHISVLLPFLSRVIRDFRVESQG